jgi:hypothetical protein
MEGLSGEDLNWKPIDSANSLYVLATHTMGNVENNILHVLSGQPSVRDRDAEFVAQGTDPEKLRVFWQDLQVRINTALAALSPSDLDRLCSHPTRGSITGREVLLNTARHAAEHAGHAELTRDLLRMTQK